MTTASRSRWTEQHYPDPPFGPEGTGLLFAVIYRPGGVSEDNVVTTWQEVQAAVDAVMGTIVIYVDSSIQPATIPPGTWNGYGAPVLTTFNSGLANGYSFNRAAPGLFAGPVLITIEDGATLVNYAALENIVVVCNCVTAPAFSFSQFSDFIISNFSVIYLNVGAHVPAIQNNIPGFSFALVSSLGTLDNSSAPTIPVVNTSSGSTTTFYMRDAAPNFSALFTGNEIGGPVGSQVFWENDASVPPLTSSLFFGTLQSEPTADPANIPYTSSNVANWSGVNPTSVANALDRIAAKVGPIP